MRNNKYKTKSCQKYWVTGYCAYGPRCNFLHYESGEHYDSQSPTKIVNVTTSKDKESSSDQDSSVKSARSEDDLVETVQFLLDNVEMMEKQKICDPSLEDLFVKLKRALPSKRTLTPGEPISSGSSMSGGSNRVSPLQSSSGGSSTRVSPLSIGTGTGNAKSDGGWNPTIWSTPRFEMSQKTMDKVEKMDRRKSNVESGCKNSDIFSWIDSFSDQLAENRALQQVPNQM